MNVLSVGLATTAVLAFWTGPAPAETAPLTPGYYEVVVSGAPGGGTQTRKRCVTVEHVADPDSVFNYAFAKPYKPFPDHKVINYASQGGAISYDVETSFTTTHVEGTVSSSEFSIVRTTKAKSGKSTAVTMKLDGKRTRDCHKGD
ncbi:MAG: hypothetical protein H8K04_14630 [Nitrospira sp.]